jgi:phage tail protein X
MRITPLAPPPMPPVAAVAEPILIGAERLPIPEPHPKRVYISIQGDWWDLIALKCYGMRRGDDHLMHKLIEANYALRDLSHFPAGIPVYVPDVPVKTSIPLVPWKRASIVTSP